MDVYLVRHTNVGVAAGICYGRTDVPLAESFPAEAEAVQRRLPAGLAHVYSSPLTRCRRLAERLTPTPMLDDRLLEYDFGEWEMQPWAEIKGEAAALWFADFVNVAAPSGEQYAAMGKRVIDFWEELVGAGALRGGKTAVVTHAGVIRIVLAHLLEMPLRKAFNLSIDTGSVSKLTVHAHHTQVEWLNDRV